jgi:ribonuclease Z
MKLVFLGTGGTYPSKFRNVTSIAVQMASEVLMFDCGEGTQRQLMFSPVSFMRIGKIFISHLHADHFLGLPGLIQSMSLNGREDELRIYGPDGMEDTVKSILSLGYFKSGYKITAEDVAPGTTLEFDNYAVRCIEASHSVPSLAFSLEEASRPGRFDVGKAKRLGIPEGPLYRRLQQGKPITVAGRQIRPEEVLGSPRKGRKIVYTGDTKPSQEIVELARDADVLIHDCTLDSSHKELAASFGHSTAAEAALVAKEAGVHMLFLVHLSPRYDDGEILEREAKQIFKNSKVAEELSEHIIRYRD